MAREGLLVELRAAISAAKRTRAPVRREGVRLRYEEQPLTITIQVIPLKAPPPAASHCLVLFEEPGLPPARRRGKAAAPTNGQTARPEAQLRQELEATKEYLQSTIEQQEATNEELKSANEEILSSNEELQSTNEELHTVNEEVQHRNRELSQANNDLNNLFGSSNLPIILLGADLRIRRCTAVAEKVLKIIPTDIGRPIGDLKLAISIPDVESLIVEVMDTVQPREREVQDRQGHWHLMRVLPYRSDGKAIEGAVLLFIDIDSLKDVARLTALVQEVERVRDYAQGIVEAVTDPDILQLFGDSKHRIRSMALVHEKLYSTTNLSRIEMGSYIQSLVGPLQQSFPAPPTIRVSLEVQQVTFGIDTAIACGLMLNELISNAFKYAFPGRQTGEVFIGLRQASEGHFVLVVRDQGVGLPGRMDGIVAARYLQEHRGIPVVFLTAHSEDQDEPKFRGVGLLRKLHGLVSDAGRHESLVRARHQPA